MDSLLVGLLTAVPVFVGFAVGRRAGGSRVCSWLGPRVLAALGGIATTVTLFQLGIFWPLGLVTPLVLGVLAARIAYKLSQLAINFATDVKLKSNGSLGGLIGSFAGLMVAVVGWQAILLSTGSDATVELDQVSDATKEIPRETSLQRLAVIANDGLIQHLPIAGPMTQDLIAIREIMDTPIEVRKQFAISKGWDDLANLPSFVALVEDESLIDQIESATKGNLLALYRLQRNPLVIEFARERQLQDLFQEFDVQQIAAELETFESDNETKLSASRRSDQNF